MFRDISTILKRYFFIIITCLYLQTFLLNNILAGILVLNISIFLINWERGRE